MLQKNNLAQANFGMTMMKNNALKIRPATPADNKWLDELMNRDWGGLPLVIRGKKYYPSTLDGIIAENESGIAGFLYYEVRDKDCEIIVFEVFDKFKGTGTIVLNKLKEVAKDKNHQRIYLMTTNDNLDALRFYQKRGFHICGVHIDSVKNSRKIKPTIGMIGDHDIPVRDEIDLEFVF
jgi:GNAT superfamily N-acetyltransferase